jgi:predicted esterase
VAVLLPKSSGYTWDAVLGGFGPDVAELDRLLEATSGMLAVDPGRIAVAGFSDGASYALSVGRINGDLFGSILAFSPGFVVPGPPAGTPRIFVSHGTADPVLPIERCSRLLVPALRREGYEVDYREFDGGHVVPPELAEEALRTVARGPATA